MKTLRWRSVTGGIIAVAVLISLTLFVLLYAKAGALHGTRFVLFAAAPDANNLRVGSEVWLNGQRVGTVRKIEFNRPTVPVDLRVVIELGVLKSVQPLIRLDSRASLRNAGSVIGEPVVYIESGTHATRSVVTGDTLRAAGNPDLEIAASKATVAMEQLPALFADGREILANTKTAGRRMSAILAGGTGRDASLKNARAALAKVTGSRGSASRIMRDSVLRAHVTRSMASVDSVRHLVSSRTAELGRFRRDSSLAPAVRELQSEIARLRVMAASTDGDVGRARGDSALRRGLDSAHAELAALLADIKAHPSKYARVF